MPPANFMHGRLQSQLQKVFLRSLSTEWAGSFCVLVVVTLTGCGGMPATLSGQVTIDGEPVQTNDEIRGQVLLQPRDSSNAPASGPTGSDGRYTVLTGNQEGVAPGAYAVTVSVVRTIPPKREGEMPWAERLTSPKYASPSTSDLEVTIEPGGNEYDLALESQPAGPRR